MRNQAPALRPSTAALAAALVACLAAALPLTAAAQAPTPPQPPAQAEPPTASQPAGESAGEAVPKPANEQVIEPQVERRPIRLPRFPSNDFEVGLFAGAYATENFGSTQVDGLRVGYHVTEDVFIEAVYGRTKVNDATFRQILPGGIFPEGVEPLRYYNISAGFNVLPGEVFLGKNMALSSQAYLIGGVGSTRFNQQRLQTFNLGLGLRVYLGEGMALQADMRDHIFSLDLLGERRITQNLEMTVGLTFFF